MKNLTIAVLVVLVVVFGALLLLPHSQPVSSGSGQPHTSHEDFAGGASFGSGIFSVSVTTSTPTSTLTAAQVCNNGLIQFNPTNVSSSQGALGITTGTITMPSAQSMASYCLPYNGSRYTVSLQNLGGATTSSITIAVGASSTLSSDVPSSSVPNVLVGAKAAWIQFLRISPTSAVEFFSQGY